MAGASSARGSASSACGLLRHSAGGPFVRGDRVPGEVVPFSSVVSRGAEHAFEGEAEALGDGTTRAVPGECRDLHAVRLLRLEEPLGDGGGAARPGPASDVRLREPVPDLVLPKI